MKETNRNRANVAKRRARQRKLRNRRIALTVCLMLVVMVASIGGTVAWLTAKTDSVVNTFTYGDINITLAETTGNDYKIIPGVDISKNPKVTVAKDSEACWLFVEVKEESWLSATETVDGKAVRKVDYAIADGWNELAGVTGPNGGKVYYREVPAATDAAAEFYVLKDNKVTVRDSLTKQDIKNAGQAKLTFTAYAVQLEGFAGDAAGAWEQAKTATITTP